MRVGCDPWVGCSPNFSLSRDLVAHLNSEGFFYLNQVADPRSTSLVKQGWMSSTNLHLDNRWMEEWNRYVADLSLSSVRISDSADILRWVHAQTGVYTPKFGYKWLMTQEGWGNPAWWSKPLWKLKSPAKTRLFFWCILHNKVPTWDFLQKRGKQGPSWCSLCKSEEESPQHLFLFCPFNASLWAETLHLTNIPLRWHGENLLQAWESWWQEASDDKIRAFPLLIAWGTWIARNRIIFNESTFPLARLAAEGAAIFDSIPSPAVTGSSRNIQPESINESFPWAYFDGASDDNDTCGAGLVIHFSTENSLRASVGLGQGSNNFAELKALHLLLCWLISKQINQIQIFGDSRNVVNWFNGTQQCRNFILLPLLKEIRRLKSFFSEISVIHIYRERNQQADILSKEDAQLALGTWAVAEVVNGTVQIHEQPLFV